MRLGNQFIDVICTVTRANLKQSPIAIVYIATGNLSENSNATSRQPQVALAHAQASAFLKPMTCLRGKLVVETSFDRTIAGC